MVAWFNIGLAKELDCITPDASGGQLFAEKVGQNCLLSALVGHTICFSAMLYKLAHLTPLQLILRG